MKIESSMVALTSQHAGVERDTVRESLRFWSGNARPDFEGQARGPGRAAAVVSISEAARAAQSQEAEAIKDSAEEAENDPRVQLILRMVEALTGRKIKLFKAGDLQPDADTQKRLDKAGEAAQQQRAGWGLEYDYHASHYEAEQTTFSARGVIQTADGKEINFNLELAMSREYYEETNVSLRAGDAVRKDPLVINFDGTAAELTDAKFAFDIDSDGTLDSISFVGPGSGFLALDRNANGRIDNGAELFGTESGNGFADLARHDSDGNRWIDQNDAVFADLRVWRKDAGGADSLTTLAQGGGALYLGNVATPFSVNTTSNENLGQVRSSGIYLSENGAAGTLQQIDLAV